MIIDDAVNITAFGFDESVKPGEPSFNLIIV